MGDSDHPFEALSDAEGAVFSDGDESDADYEDLDMATIGERTASAANARVRVIWAQRLLISTRVLTMAHLFLNIRLIMFAWTLYTLLGRFFVLLPFALEGTLALVFAALGSQAFWLGRRTTYKRCTLPKFISCGFYLIQSIYTIIVLAKLDKIVHEVFFENLPVNKVNSDWQWMYDSWIAFSVLSSLNIIISFGLIISILGHWWCTSKMISEYEGLRPKRSKLGQTAYFITLILYFLLVCAILVMLGMGVGSLINVSARLGNSKQSSSQYQHCDPIDPTMCTYPFPSSYYLAPDDSTPTKLRVAFGEKSFPKTMDGGRISPKYWNELDGFSTIAPILFYLQDADNSTLIPHTHIEWYLNSTVSTAIINVKTGQRVPHWAEIDRVDASEPSIILQPAVPLDLATQYVVGVQNIYNSKRELIRPVQAFADLISVTQPTNSEAVERWEKYRKELLPVLFANGFDRSKLQLAWDFTTYSSETVHGRYEQMRSIAMEWSPELTIIEDREIDCATDPIGRTVTAKLTVPRFLVPNHRRGSLLPRDSNGRSEIQVLGTDSVFVEIRIPCSLTSAAIPQPATQVVQYGHGLFGGRAEVQSAWASLYMNENKMIFFASDWYGMSHFDRMTVTKLILSDPSKFSIIPESTLQGWANKVVVYNAMQSGVLHNYLKVGGMSLINPSTPISYYGISQGGVMGGGYVSSSPYLQRAVLGVPGSPFALLLGRSHDFDSFKKLFKLNFYTWRDIRLTLNIMQQVWDQAESAGWLKYMNQDTPIGIPKKNVLIQDAHGDAQVTILGARIMARSFNASNLLPTVEHVWGMNERTGPFVGSALTEWVYNDTPEDPFENVPPNQQYDTHECVRREPAAQAQVTHFLNSGEIIHTCSGPCRLAICLAGRHPTHRRIDVMHAVANVYDVFVH